MRVYNTLRAEKEELVPLRPGEFRIYVCGPTVYNYIHIGNARPLCVFDVLRRYLVYSGNKVLFVQNFTDIDDKIIRRANEEGSDYLSVSERFIREYETDAKGLNIMPADISPRASENIDEIIEIISGLIEKGHAYRAENGDVYFSAESFADYGALSHQKPEELYAGARINIGEQKRSPGDFALWKGAKPGEPFWDSPFGKGRPGWHIECSAMIRKYIGKTADIHCGGRDLIFPHHENERAQSESLHGLPLANYWMHNGYINIDNIKMSKSKGNFLTVREAAESFGYGAVRYLMLSSHYRSPINYSSDIMKQCVASLQRLSNCRSALEFALQNCRDTDCGDKEEEPSLLRHGESFREAMDDDLNTADALAAIFELVRDINTRLSGGEPSLAFLKTALNEFDELTGVLGFEFKKQAQTLCEDELSEIEALIEKRNEARGKKDFALADKIRDSLRERGIVLEDTPQGIKWHRE